MKKNQILVIGLTIVIAIVGTTYFYLNYYGKAKGDTIVSDTVDIDESSEDEEAISNVIPIVTMAPTDSPKEESQTRLSKNRYVATQIIDGEKKYGYITEKGEFIIKAQYSSASDFINGAAIVYKADKSFMIDLEGEILFSSDIGIIDYKNGVAIFSSIKGDNLLYGYVNDSGKIIIEPQYENAYEFNEEGQAYVKLTDGNYALINIKGQIITSYDFNSKYSNIYQMTDGYVIYYDSNSGKYGVDDLISGESIYEPIYSSIKYLGENLFAMKDPRLEFYEISDMSPNALFNNKGQQITDYELYDISYFNGEYASVTDSTSTYFIGQDGKEITTLPKVLGRGTLTILGDVVKAEIDNDLYYITVDGDIIYQTKNEYDLGTGIIVKEVKFKANKYVLVRYPKIEGLKDIEIQEQVNEQLETIFTQYRIDSKEEDGLTVNDSFIPTLKKNLIIISMRGYDYSFGAAHGMPLRENYFIDINTGKFYKLNDLFKPGSDYETKINEIISDEINKRMKDEEDFYFSDAFTGINADHDFILTDNSIIIYFYPYDIAAYAQGFPEFEIPFNDIIDLLDTDGEFYKAFN